MYRFALSLSIWLIPVMASAQWYEFKPVVRVKDLDGRSIRFGASLNDMGQVLYATATINGTTVYIDDQAVLHLPDAVGTARIGDLNNAGHFTFTNGDELYLGHLGGETTKTIQQSDQLELTYDGPGTTEVSTSKLDNLGNPHFLASSKEDLVSTEGGQVGTANLYRGSDVLLDEAFGVSEFSRIMNGVNNFDVNDHGAIAISFGGTLQLPPDSEPLVDTFIGAGRFSHVSLNNLGDFTQVSSKRIDNITVVPTIRVTSEDNRTLAELETGEKAIRAIVNDQRRVAYETGLGVAIWDVATENSELVVDLELSSNVLVADLYDYNDEGQMALRLVKSISNSLVSDVGIYLASPIDSPNGDFTLDGLATAEDIDFLAAQIQIGSSHFSFDIDQDGIVSSLDHQFLIEDILKTRHGDADLDGDIDFTDFLRLSTNFGMDAGWAGGDFTGDHVADFEDFLLLGNKFGSTSWAAVSEPEAGKAVLLSVLILLGTQHVWSCGLLET